MLHPFELGTQEIFPGFDYRNPRPEICPRLDFRRMDNVVGFQQRAVTNYWALKMCSPIDLGIDFGSPKGLTPHCICVDLFGNGKPHPVYGGARYCADVAISATDVTHFPEDAWPYIASNHSLEHMRVPGGDAGIVDLLVRWTSLLRQGGVLAMVIPDNDHIDVLAVDKDHVSAWGAKDFRRRVLDKLLVKRHLEVVEYDTLQNHFSFNVILRKC